MGPKREPKMPRGLRIALLVGIVILLICLLLGSGGSFHPAGRASAAAMMMALNTAAENYMTDSGPFPKNLDNHIFWADVSGADSGKVYMSFKTNQQNDKGEIIDPWGTPLRIWYISDNQIGMRSAGNDKTFGTQDDITSQ